MTTAIEDQTTKPLRRQVARSPKRPAAKSVKKGIYLTLENARRLQVTSAWDCRSDSDVINELIERHLRGLVVSDRRSSSPSQDMESAESPGTL